MPDPNSKDEINPRGSFTMNGSIFALRSRRRRRLSVEALEGRQLLATITVNTTADDTTGDSTLSLREAIEVSDGTLAVSSLSAQQQGQVSGAVGSTNTIDFNIPTSDSGYDATTGVWTITVGLNSLPSISTNAAIINGYSQPGSSENTLASGDNAKLTIALDGDLTGLDGLTIAQQGSKVSGLDIEKCENGIVVAGDGNVQVAGCFIGVDPTGETSASNANGVEIQSSNNLIGGPNVGDRNVISSNIGSCGIYVPDQSLNPLGITPTGNAVENNVIGLDATGTKLLPNGEAGVSDNGSGDTYGGTTAGLGNVVSGNGGHGIIATGSVTIEGNFIGTDATGTVALGNGPTASGGLGISISNGFQTNAITGVISNNLISGDDDGIEISLALGSQSSFTISNNLIGTNLAGTSALPDGGNGIQLGNVENATVQNNVISADYAGIVFQTAAPTTELQHDVFQGNLIGTDKTGTVALGNKGIGIEIDSGSGITIGGTGPGQGNVIANNVIGIDLSAGQQDQFTQNSIYGNTGEYGVPPGIVMDAGANESIAAPALQFAPGSGGSGTLSGSVTGAPSTNYVVELFSNPSATSTAQAQGQTFVKAFTVMTDSTGHGSLSATEPNGLYTATATDSDGDTSVFSNVAGAQQALPASTTAISSSLNPAPSGQQVTFTAVVTAPSYQGTPTGTVTFTIDGQNQSPVQLSVKGGVDEAQFVATSLSAGQHSVTAAYSGDAKVGPSGSSSLVQIVTTPSLPSSTTTLTSSLNPSTLGQQVTFTAVVTAPSFQGTPTGTVTFIIDGHPQSPLPLAMVGSNDQVQFSTSTLSAGSHTVSASYSGDMNVNASSAAALTQTVNSPGLVATSTSLASSLDPSTAGQAVAFTAIVSPGATAGTPTGSVTFTLDGIAHAPVPLQVVNGKDEATFAIESLASGSHNVSAAYNGDSTFASSAVSRSLVQTVNAVVVAPNGDPPPTIEAVQRFGIHREPTVVVISFNEALDPTSAVNLNNYKITGPSDRTVPISSVVFNADSNTVTLRPAKRINLHDTYHLTVIGTGPNGVRSSHDVLLDGTDSGAPDGDYKGTLNWQNVVLTPTQEKKFGNELRQIGRNSDRPFSRPVPKFNRGISSLGHAAPVASK
jgi:CSLREA domain-containing protein